MASYLASIYGTEQDRVNCSFYYKIGACRHGDRCSRKHTKPAFSQTILIANVYQNPKHSDPDCDLTESQLQSQFDDFFEDFFCELANYGHLAEMHVCDNVGEHLIGNVYARYEFEDEAQNAVDSLNNRWYAGRPLFAELSPVTDFREACCRQHETLDCTRGGFCNFMHLRYATPSLVRQLQHELSVELSERKKEERRRQKEEQFASKKGKKSWRDRDAGDEGGGGGTEEDGKDGDEETNDGGGGWRKGESGGDWRSSRKEREKRRRSASPDKPKNENEDEEE